MDEVIEIDGLTADLEVDEDIVEVIEIAEQGPPGPPSTFPGPPGPPGASGSAGDGLFDPVFVSQFDTASAEGWLGVSSTFSFAERGYLTVTPTIANAGLYKVVAIDGGLYDTVKVRVKRLLGAGWDGTCYYATAGHGYSNLHRKTLANPLLAIGDEVTLSFDMADLTAGGSDWVDNQITGIRLDLGNAIDDVFSFDWIAVGRQAPVSADGGSIDGEPLLTAHLAAINHKPGTLRNLRDSLTNPLEQLTGLAFCGDSITWGRTLIDGGVYDPRTGQLTDPRDNATSGSFVNELRRYFGQQYFDAAVQSLSNWGTSPSGESIGEFKKIVYLYTGLAPFVVDMSGDKSVVETKTTGTVLGYRHILSDNALVDDGGFIEVQWTMTGDRFALLYTSISSTANADYELYVNDVLIGRYGTWSGVVANGVRREHLFDYVRDGVVRLRLKRTSYAQAQKLYLDAIEITKTLRIYNQGIIGATSYSYAERMFEIGDTVALPEVNHAIIQLGTNDRARTFPNNNQTNGVLNFKRNLGSVIDLLPGVNVVLMGSLPAENEDSATYCMTMQEVRAAIRGVAVERQLDFIDNYAIFRGYSLDAVTADGLHPNELGHELIARHIIGLLEDQPAVLMDDYLAAMHAANAPSGANPFATKADLASKIYHPASVAVTAGTLVSGNAAALATAGDGLLLLVDEVVGVGLTVKATFTDVENFNLVSIRSRYNGGAGHQWQFRLYNYLLGAMESISTDIGSESALTWHSFAIPNAANYISAGVVEVEFYHIGPYINGHQGSFDFVGLVQSNSGATEYPATQVKTIPAGGLTSTTQAATNAELQTNKLAKTNGVSKNLQGERQPTISTAVSSIDWALGHVIIDYAGNTNLTGGFDNIPTTTTAALQVILKHNGGIRTFSVPVAQLDGAFTLGGTSGGGCIFNLIPTGSGKYAIVVVKSW